MVMVYGSHGIGSDDIPTDVVSVSTPCSRCCRVVSDELDQSGHGPLVAVVSRPRRRPVDVLSLAARTC